MPIKILNESQLSMFLQILAEESVKKAYESELSSSVPLFEQGEEDPLFSDEKDTEKEEDPLAGLDGGDDKGGQGDMKTAPEQPQQAEKPKQDKVDVRPTPLTLELGEVTSDGLIATLNMVRAGRSFKEPDVSAQLKKYFDEQLNDSERLALATFLSAIRDLTSGTPAEDAPEPGDENVNIDATGKEREEQAPQQRLPSKPALRQSTGHGVEDIAPPIQVGPRNAQIAEDYRKHIRSLLIK